ncbi:MAG: sugar phosphate isomerase/epimerase family protein [Verrucomicrobiota bacterium]
MNQVKTALIERLAVCSWSLQCASPGELAGKILTTGIPRVQLALDPLRESPEIRGRTAAEFQKNGITIVSGMFGCVGEDYSTLETIRQTGGIAPDATWPHNLSNIRATAVLAEALGLKLVTFHAGFLPHDPGDSAFHKLAERLGLVADVFAAQNIELGLETGQESAAELAAILRAVNRPNLGVNFDPANVILYGRDNVPGALQLLAPWIRQVHIKDACRTKMPGTWGEEVVVGTGEVDWRAFFAALTAANYGGHFVIEREAGASRVADIRAAKGVIEQFT